MKDFVFKLYFPNGKTLLSHPFGDLNFPDCFHVFSKKIIFAVDTSILIGEYNSEQRALEVYDDIINSYNSHNSFTLPKD